MATDFLRSSLLLGLCACLGSTAVQATASDAVEAVQRAAVDWAKIRAETVRLESEWDEQRKSLEAALVALRARVERLRQERDSLEAAMATDAVKSTDLQARVAREQDAMRGLEERIERIAQGLLAVRPHLPPRLAEGLELAFASIQDPALGPAERLQHLVTIFNRCGAFNKTITLAEQDLALDKSGRMRLLDVLYVGLSHAYAYDRTNNVAYFGHPGATAWTWEEQPDAAPAVVRMISIFREEKDPAFVVAPARISDPFRAGNPP